MVKSCVCGKPHYAKGLCKNHYRQEWVKKNPGYDKRKRKRYPEYHKASYARRKQRDPNGIINDALKTNYGITLQQYNEMWDKQGGFCALHKGPETAIRLGKLTALAVDHDPKTGRVRGLLCSKCNQALRPIDEYPGWLEAAKEYVNVELNAQI